MPNRARQAQKPQRTCLGCGTRADQDKLLRLAVTGQDELQIRRNQGRGGYLHRDSRCLKAFVGRKGLYRAFHVEVSRTAKAKLIEELMVRDWE